MKEEEEKTPFSPWPGSCLPPVPTNGWKLHAHHSKDALLLVCALFCISEVQIGACHLSVQTFYWLTSDFQLHSSLWTTCYALKALDALVCILLIFCIPLWPLFAKFWSSCLFHQLLAFGLVSSMAGMVTCLTFKDHINTIYWGGHVQLKSHLLRGMEAHASTCAWEVKAVRLCLRPT